MTTLAAAPVSAPKNTHARSTVAILATVRLIGLIAFAGLIGLTFLGTLGMTFSADDNKAGIFVLGIVGIVFQAIFAALWYAGISWLTETLNMLTQIAKNTTV